MRFTRSTLAAMLTVTIVLGAGTGPQRAIAETRISVARAANLMMPVSGAPAGWAPRPSMGHTLTDRFLAPWLGKHVLSAFHQNGYRAGYQGWLEETNSEGSPFAIYDVYGFAGSTGARQAQDEYQRLMRGLPTIPQDSSALPADALLWTDGTGTFGPTAQPYAEAEILFRNTNIVIDVTAFHAGTGIQTLAVAEAEAISVSNACARWLDHRDTQLRRARMSVVPSAVLSHAIYDQHHTNPRRS